MSVDIEEVVVRLRNYAAGGSIMYVDLVAGINALLAEREQLRRDKYEQYRVLDARISELESERERLRKRISKSPAMPSPGRRKEK